MRISDWSSDVCSSDLLWCRRGDDRAVALLIKRTNEHSSRRRLIGRYRLLHWRRRLIGHRGLWRRRWWRIGGESPRQQAEGNSQHKREATQCRKGSHWRIFIVPPYGWAIGRETCRDRGCVYG